LISQSRGLGDVYKRQPERNPATAPIAMMTGIRGVGVGTKSSLTAGNRMER
jgi:hypothetical protein